MEKQAIVAAENKIQADQITISARTTRLQDKIKQIEQLEAALEDCREAGRLTEALEKYYNDQIAELRKEVDKLLDENTEVKKDNLQLFQKNTKLKKRRGGWRAACLALAVGIVARETLKFK